MDNQAQQEPAGEAVSGPLTVDQAVERLMAGVGEDSQEQPADDAPEARQPATPETEDEADDEEVGEADDSSEDDEAEGEEADPAEDDEDQADEQSASVDDAARVQLGDGTEITVAELKSGYLRQQDYTRKTQEVSEERKQARDALQRVNGFSQEIMQRLQMADQLAQLAAPAPPDDSLYESDPIAYFRAKEQYQEAARDYAWRVQQIRDGLAQTQQLTEEASTVQSQEELDQARAKLREMVPELADPEKSKTVVNDVLTAAQKLGFSQEEVTSWRDPRFGYAMVLASKALKMDAQRPKAASKIKGKKPVQKPGTQQSPKAKQRGQYGAAMKRLQKTGSAHDAVDALAVKMGISLDD